MRNRLEVGIIRCDRHTPHLDIQEIVYKPGIRDPICSSLIPHKLNLDEDLSINLIYPDEEDSSQCKLGVSTYTRRGFDRLDDTGDDEDFRWVPDLEGAEFHNAKLTIVKEHRLQPTIFISDGILYTRQKTDELFARTAAGDERAGRLLGKVGNGISADINRVKGGSVVLSNRSAHGSPEYSDSCSVVLEERECVQYLITIENHCQSPYGFPDESEGTDFRLFYEVLKDPAGKRFDLRRIVETGHAESAKGTLKGREDFVLDGWPESCLGGYLSQTQSLTDGG
jgi:hypothetical protein